MNLTLLNGNALDMLRTLESESVDSVVSSPPYWSLRDYGVNGQIGLEQTFEEYLAKLVEVFEECRRVLKKTGTLWINMGDAYAGSWGGQGGPQNLSVPREGVNPDRAPNQRGSGLAAKNLIGQPWRLAFALQDAGWILRSEIIWHKPNPMPESVRDRPTRSHETIFLFAKSRHYFYDGEAIAEPVTASTIERISQPNLQEQLGSERANGGAKTNGNMKAVIKEKPSGWANSANFKGQDPRYPNRSNKDALPDNFKGSVPGRQDGPGQDRRSRNPRKDVDSLTLRNDASERMGRAPGWRETDQPITRNARTVWTIATQPYKKAHFATFPVELPRRCILAGCPPCGTVLDPFAGSGTTLAVAIELGRKAIGIELNPEYCDLIRERVERSQPPLPEEDIA